MWYGDSRSILSVSFGYGSYNDERFDLILGKELYDGINFFYSYVSIKRFYDCA